MGEPKGLILKPEKGYYPTMVTGVCRKCHVVGTLDIPPGNYQIGDAVMSRKPVPADCEKCGQRTEFIPVPLDPTDPRFKFLIQEEIRRLKEAGVLE